MKGKLRRVTAYLCAAVIVFNGARGINGSAVSAEEYFSEAEVQEVGDFHIRSYFLKAGVPAEAENTQGYTVRWYVNDSFAGEGVFVPSEDDYEKWIRAELCDGEDVLASDSAYFSRLPVIYINTDDGEGITSKDEYKSASFVLQNNEECGDYIYSGKTEIKGRGNSSWKWLKKPYKIKLDKKADFYGMGKSKHWVLLANYLDTSLQRNTIAAGISEELGMVTMQTVWTDVVINGEYAGNYQLCEQIRIGDDRVEIYDWEDTAGEIADRIYKAGKPALSKDDRTAMEELLKTDLSWVTSGVFEYGGEIYNTAVYLGEEPDISGGYLFELDNLYDELSKFMTKDVLKVMIKSPEYLYTNEDMMKYVQDFWQAFEDGYSSEDGYADYKGERVHYTELCDLDSLVKFWLINEITGNVDSASRSRFAYLDRGEKLVFGPAWDFDYVYSSFRLKGSVDKWAVARVRHEQVFYPQLLDDPLFLERAAEIYWSVRESLGKIYEDGGIIDTNYNLLRTSGLADEARWPRSEQWPEEYRGFEEETQILKNWYRDHIAWLDRQFESCDTLLKSTHTTIPYYPYERSADMTLTVRSSSADVFSENAAAEYCVGEKSDAVVTIKTENINTVSADVYVNGIYAGSADINSGTASFVAESEMLYGDTGRKNVISVTGRDSEGKTSERNFVTVLRHSGPADYVPYGVQLTLGDNIGVTVLIRSDADGIPDDSVTAEITAGDSETVSLGLGSLNTREINGTKYYEAAFSMLPCEAEKPVSVRIRSGEITTAPVTFTINDYLETVQSADNTGSSAGLIKALREYMQSIQAYRSSQLAASNTVVPEKFSLNRAEMERIRAELDGSASELIVAMQGFLKARSEYSRG